MSYTTNQWVVWASRYRSDQTGELKYFDILTLAEGHD